MRAALVNSEGLVENVILVGPDYDPPEALTLVTLVDEDQVGPGWRRVNGEWVEPEPVEPEPVEPAPTPQELQQQIDDMTDLLAFMMGGM